MPAPKGNQYAVGNEGGRPTLYRPEYNELARKHCLLGATDEDLARLFEVSEVTINSWKKEHVEFLNSIKAGREEADANVANSLYKRAIGYTTTEEKAFAFQGSITTATVELEIIPDVKAAEIWLKNRQPKKWRDQIHLEVTDNKIDFTKLSPEEKKTLLALLDKANDNAASDTE